MAVFPLENGVFSGTLLRFNVRGYVYIWSLIFSMFNFLCLWVCSWVQVCLCVLIVIYACSLCASMYSLYMLLIVHLFREMGKWDLGGMGNGLLNGLIGGMGN